MPSETIMVDSITASNVPAGGATMTVVAKEADREVLLIFPYDQIPSLLEVAVWGRTECKRQQGKEPNDDADLLIIKRFEFGREKVFGLPVLILTMTNGGKLAWAFQGGMEAQLYETIGTFLGLLKPSFPTDVRAN